MNKAYFSPIICMLFLSSCGLFSPPTTDVSEIAKYIDPTPNVIRSLPQNTRIDSIQKVDIENVTRADVKAIWDEACGRYGVEYIYHKRIDKGALSAAQQVSDALGFAKAVKLLEARYVTLVLGDRKVIVTADEIGKSGDVGCQLETLAHELQHSVELNLARYALDKGYRARVEGRGEAAGSDPRQLFGRPASPPADVFGPDWRNTYRLSTTFEKKAMETYSNLVARHDQGLFATQVGADVARIISKRMHR